MPKEYGFSHRFGRWLEMHGFVEGDPFAIYEADQERPHLHEFFIDRPYLHDIFGDPARPQAAFLLAGRGDGKTATREMVAYECEHTRTDRRALAVRYNDFGLLLDQVLGDPTLITAQHHVHAITRSTLRAMAEDVPPLHFDLMRESDRALLMSFAVKYADAVSLLKLTPIIKSKPASLDWDRLSPRETLLTLAELTTQIGRSEKLRYQALYVLVDRVDETAVGPTAAVTVLRPLVSEGPLLEATHVAFKFFLPREIGEKLRQELPLRSDRVCIRAISWDRTALEDMICQRLVFYSGGVTQRFEDLCEPTIKGSVMDRLIKASDNSPRTLLRLCGALMRHHVAGTDDMLINRTSLTETLYDFGQQLQVERTGAPRAPAARAQPAEPVIPPPSGLYLDSNGHVWIDGARITPPLPPLEFKLLETLFKQAPEIVSSEALIQAVWHAAEPWQPGGRTHHADEQNLRKLITRVRTRLELQSPDKNPRFLHNVHGRGYWLKIN